MNDRLDPFVPSSLRPTMNHRYCITLSFLFLASSTFAAELFEITPETRPEIGGKEVDWIDGDVVLRNDKIVAVIAAPVAGRDANMTVRGVGGGLIDVTRRDDMSDQLSAFYPTARQFDFIDPTRVTSAIVDGLAYWECESIPNGDGVTATVRYELSDDDHSVGCRIRLRGDQADIDKVRPADGVRADRTFKFDVVQANGQPMAVFSDSFFAQAYGIVSSDQTIDSMTWDRERMRSVTYTGLDPSTLGWAIDFYPGGSTVDLMGLVSDASPQSFIVSKTVGGHPRPSLTILSTDAGKGLDDTINEPITLFGGSSAFQTIHLAAGTYRVRVDAVGHESAESDITITQAAGTHELTLGAATVLKASVRDDAGKSLPAKLTLYGTEGTPSPDFGPDSTDGSVKNCVYTVNGQAVQAIPPGSYDCIISYGPEYDAETRPISIASGQTIELDVTLRRVVDTAGWISCELHSHSSPSGDNTSSQLGRVENLVCEHIEFGPCTEHQRIESYDDQLEALDATDLMATCSGMELTGGPLPINHQNVFPLKWRPFEQAGGGPRTDRDPIAQIQRIAMWDNAADKVVQINHPDLNQMARDKDKDGKEDGGFASMFQFADVIEVHPPQAIFENPDELSDDDLRDNRMLQWLRLISEGTRIPGVVNTDAHYNHHGSGWLRNWVVSSTDDASEISIDEMTKNLEAGRVIMSTGPFMTVQLHSQDLKQPAEIGDDVELRSNQAELAVKIQCANWLDVNRVEVFVNGHTVPELSRRRATHPDAFANGVIKFDQTLPLTIDEDTFIVVAAIGEDMKLGRVMGEQFGQEPPIVVSNPIYVRSNPTRQR